VILPFGGKKPKIAHTAFVHPMATVIGDVTIGAHSSVWPGAVVRGDFSSVKIGEYVCVQDNAVIHPADTYEKGTRYLPVKVGNYVVIGHNALLHGCTVEDNCIVGAGSIIFNGARLRTCTLVGMGAVVLTNAEVPSRTIVVGVPARPLRRMLNVEIRRIKVQAENYAKLARRYKKFKI
jgi:carbonic anhydrase/acetyltransferase-like protein (isoleucine patch superfamily)